MQKRFACAVLLFAAVLLMTADAAGGDPFSTGSGQSLASAWPTFHHDNQRTGGSAYRGARLQYVRSRFYTGAPITASPVIDTDGTVYIGSWNGYFYAVDSLGLLKWRYKTGDIIRSSAAISLDGNIYVGSNDHTLYAFTRAGALLWAYTTGGAIVSSPAVDDEGTVYFGSSDAAVYAVRSDGSLKWKNSDPARGVDTAPAIGYDGKIYVGSWDKFVYQLDWQTGLVEWWWPYKGYFFTEDTEEYCFYGGIFSSPAIASDGSIYIANDTINRDNECAPEDDYFYFRLIPCGRNCAGGFRISLGEEDVYSTAAVRDDLSSYIGYGKRIVHVMPDGVLAWSYETGGKVDSSPALDFNSNVYVGSADGYLYALAGNGDLLWKFETYGPISSSPAIGPDGAIYVGSDDGWLYTLGGALCPISVLLQGEEESLGRFRTFRDRILTNSSQGRLFCAAYYRFSDEILRIFSARPRLQHIALDITEYLLTRLTSLERGQRIHIPQRQMNDILTCIAGIEEQASPELRSIIRQLRAEISQRSWFRHLGIEWD